MVNYGAFILVPFIIVVGTFFLVYFYAQKNTPILAFLVTYFGWLSAFILIGILPIDIYIVHNY